MFSCHPLLPLHPRLDRNLYRSKLPMTKGQIRLAFIVRELTKNVRVATLVIWGVVVSRVATVSVTVLSLANNQLTHTVSLSI